MTNKIYPYVGYAKALFVGITFAVLSACEPQINTSFQLISQTNTKIDRPSPRPKQHSQIWHRIRDNYDMNNATLEEKGQVEIQKYVKKYRQNERTLAKVSKQATPYLYYIVEELEKRNMPGELALLPMLESAFQPNATSHRGAAGLWQFIPSTGRFYGLKQDAWYDGRRDITASTQAALNYLEFLYEEFDQNWTLALAAYNAGEGTVHRAIKQNLRAGKPTTFWDLKLPKETRAYVPKFLALAEIVNNPAKHAISLPPIDNKPYFVPVNPKTPLNFHQAAKLADIHISELKRLNPGYRQATTHPKGPQELLLPVVNAEKFEYNFAKKR